MTAELLTKKYTIEEFLALPDDGKRYELVEGELVEMAGANEEHANIGANILAYLWKFVRDNKLGRVYGSDARYGIVPGRNSIRMADVSFVQTSRVTPGVVTMNFGPDLAIEVLSESNGYEEIEEKVSLYFGHGGQTVWVINPGLQEVYIYRAGSRQRETITVSEELVGEGVLAGFTLPVSNLFE